MKNYFFGIIVALLIFFISAALSGTALASNKVASCNRTCKPGMYCAQGCAVKVKKPTVSKPPFTKCRPGYYCKAGN